MKKTSILALILCCCGCAEQGFWSEHYSDWKRIEKGQSGMRTPVKIDKDLFFNYIDQPISGDVIDQCVQVHLFDKALNRNQCEEVFASKKQYNVNDFLLAQKKYSSYARSIVGDIYVNNIQQINQIIIIDALEHKLIDFELAPKWNDKKTIEKRYNKKVCNTQAIEKHTRSSWKEDDIIPTDCITSTIFGRGLMIDQQTPEGTRVKSTTIGGVSFLIEPNDKISQMSQGQVVAGYFIGTGKQHTYTNKGYENTEAVIKYLGF